ncbi:hypothetical protein U879_07260 [Defluviimonas sp. 20V17]|nr:hypothetical protein U879_07260 [Defluviimonas sp. 20V17]
MYARARRNSISSKAEPKTPRLSMASVGLLGLAMMRSKIWVAAIGIDNPSTLSASVTTTRVTTGSFQCDADQTVRFAIADIMSLPSAPPF